MGPVRENYGLDAPGIVRALMATGAALLVAGCAGLWLQLHGNASHAVRFVRDNGFSFGACFLLCASWMIISSAWLKQRVLQSLLDERHWNGDEQVLDIGCGRGLVAIGAARRLANGGHVTGVDIWQQQDLAGNSAAAALKNAQAAGVADKVAFHTADARSLDYADASFDVVASMTAIHNIPDHAGRQKAIDEIWRVTKPHGQILIFDIRHARSYAAQLRGRGATVRVKGPLLLWGLPGWRLSATKP